MKAIEQAIKDNDLAEMIISQECPYERGLDVPVLCKGIPGYEVRKKFVRISMCKKCWEQEVKTDGN